MVIGDGLIVIPEYFKKFVQKSIVLDDYPNQFLVIQGMRKDTLPKSLSKLEAFVTKHGSEFELINRSMFYQIGNELREVAVVKVVGLVSWKMEDLVEDEKKETKKNDHNRINTLLQKGENE